MVGRRGKYGSAAGRDSRTALGRFPNSDSSLQSPSKGALPAVRIVCLLPDAGFAASGSAAEVVNLAHSGERGKPDPIAGSLPTVGMEMALSSEGSCANWLPWAPSLPERTVGGEGVRAGRILW